MSKAISKRRPPDNAALETVLLWLGQGFNETQILEGLADAAHAETFQGIRPNDLIEAVSARLDELASREGRPRARGWCINAARTIYAKAMAIGDTKTALQSVKLVFDMTRK